MRRDVKIHETAIVGEKALIGDGTSIWQYCIIQNDVIIGRNCSFGANVFAAPRLYERAKIRKWSEAWRWS